MQEDESSLQPRAIWDGRVYAHLCLLLLEQQIANSLVSAEFRRAAQQLTTLTRVLERFPTILRDFVPSAHMLLGACTTQHTCARVAAAPLSLPIPTRAPCATPRAGQYAHDLHEHAPASTHFGRVLSSEAMHLHTLAAAAAALSALHVDPGPGGVDRAAALLQQQELSHKLPRHER